MTAKRIFLFALFVSELTLISGVAGAITLFWLIPHLAGLEARHFPVKTDWVATSTKLEGSDVVLSGTMRKVRDCVWDGSTTVRDERDRFYVVIHENTRAASAIWGASQDLIAWGPWRVVGAAGHALTFSQRHYCHPLWPTVAELGTFYSTAAQ